MHVLTESDWRVTCHLGREHKATPRRWGEYSAEWGHRKDWKHRPTYEDSFIEVFGAEWRTAVRDSDLATRDRYVYEYLGRCRLKGTLLLKLRQKRLLETQPIPRRRVHFEYQPKWREWDDFQNTDHQPTSLLDIFGDSQILVDWFNGTSWCKRHGYRDRIVAIQRRTYQWWSDRKALPAERGHSWLRHTLREGNRLADSLATRTLVRKASWQTRSPGRPSRLDRIKLRASWDVGRRDGHAAGAYAIEARAYNQEWFCLIGGGTYLETGTALQAELAGLELLFTAPQHVMVDGIQ